MYAQTSSWREPFENKVFSSIFSRNRINGSPFDIEYSAKVKTAPILAPLLDAINTKFLHLVWPSEMITIAFLRNVLPLLCFLGKLSIIFPYELLV